MKMIWVEHSVTNAVQQVTEEEYNKVLGMKGWRPCDPPKPQPRSKVPVFDPDAERRKQMRENNEKPDPEVFDPDAIRRDELTEANRAREAASFDPGQQRRDELFANNASKDEEVKKTATKPKGKKGKKATAKGGK